VVATDFALFHYDAAMAMGIAACETKRDFFSASDLYESMLSTKFEGVTGQVEFSNETGTRDLSNVQYSIFNGQSYLDPEDDTRIIFRSTKSAVVSLTPSGGWVEVITPYVYADSTTIQPLSLPLPAVDFHPIPNWALGVGLGFCSLMMLMSLGWCMWSIVHRKQRVVKASQPFFLIMLCIGTFLIATSIIPTSFQEPMSDLTLDIGCMLFPWLACVGFVTAFSALFTKNGRINAVRTQFACQQPVKGKGRLHLTNLYLYRFTRKPELVVV